MKIFCIAAVFVLSAACTFANTGKVSIFNETLLEEYQGLPQSLERQREQIAFSNGERAENCSQYDRLSAESSVTETVNDMLIKSEYLVCESLNALLSGRLMEASQEPQSAGRDLYNNLDISVLPLSIKQALPEGKRTFSELPDGTRDFDSRSLQVSYAGALISLEVVAAADLNNDGKEDWLVWLSDEVEEGNYRSYQTLILFDIGSRDSLWSPEVVNAPH